MNYEYSENVVWFIRNVDIDVIGRLDMYLWFVIGKSANCKGFRFRMLS